MAKKNICPNQRFQYFLHKIGKILLGKRRVAVSGKLTGFLRHFPRTNRFHRQRLKTDEIKNEKKLTGWVPPSQE
jgi:hypothetical protein